MLRACEDGKVAASIVEGISASQQEALNRCCQAGWIVEVDNRLVTVAVDARRYLVDGLSFECALGLAPSVFEVTMDSFIHPGSLRVRQ